MGSEVGTVELHRDQQPWDEVCGDSPGEYRRGNEASVDQLMKAFPGLRKNGLRMRHPPSG